MPVTSRAANSNSIVTTGWSNPTNAYGITTDGVYATATPGKNATVNSDYGFPNIIASDTVQLATSWTSNAQGTVNFEDVAYGNGTWVAVGDNGTLYYTTDPTAAWTQNNQGTVTFNGVAYGNGIWVAVGNNGTLYYATDPTGTWTSNTQGTQSLYGIAYGNGYWVACGGTASSVGVILYATDPTGAWTANNHGTNVLEDLDYGNGTWVVVGANSVIYYRATDPTGSFTLNTQTAVPNFFAVAYGNGYWVACGNLSGSNMIYATDPSAATWTSHSLGLPNYFGAAYGNTYFMLAGSSGTIQYVTPDPTATWSSISAGSDTKQAIAYGNGYWVVVGASGSLYYNQVTILTGIPDLSTINSVKVVVDWKLSATVTGGTLGNQPMRSGVASGTEATQTAIAEAQVSATFGTASLADLRAASTTLKGRIRCTKGSTNSALTGSLDFVRLDVDFTPPVSGSLVYDDRRVKRNGLLRRCVGQPWHRRPSGIFVPDRHILVPQPVI